MENKNYLFQHYPLEYYGSDNGLLGSGTFGEVKLYINPITQKQYAVKFETNLQVASYLKEVSQLISFEHPNILKIYDAGFFKTIIERKIKYTFYSVLELAESDFAVFISKYPYRENKLLIKKLMFDTALGLAHLASKNIIHGDIKINNILIVRDKGQYIAKIADFGFSDALLCANINTEKYLYPEVFRPIELLLESNRFGVQVDVWGLAHVFYFLTNNKLLFTGVNSTIMQEKLGKFDVLSWPEVVNYPRYTSFFQPLKYDIVPAPLSEDPLLNDLLFQMFTYNPGKRITIYDVLRHDYFLEIRNSGIEYNYPIPISCREILDEASFGLFNIIDILLNPDILSAVNGWILNMCQYFRMDINTYFLILDILYNYCNKIKKPFDAKFLSHYAAIAICLGANYKSYYVDKNFILFDTMSIVQLHDGMNEFYQQCNYNLTRSTCLQYLSNYIPRELINGAIPRSVWFLLFLYTLLRHKEIDNRILADMAFKLDNEVDLEEVLLSIKPFYQKEKLDSFNKNPLLINALKEFDKFFEHE